MGGTQNQDQESESLVENGNLRVESSELIYEETKLEEEDGEEVKTKLWKLEPSSLPYVYEVLSFIFEHHKSNNNEIKLYFKKVNGPRELIQL